MVPPTSRSVKKLVHKAYPKGTRKKKANRSKKGRRKRYGIPTCLRQKLQRASGRLGPMSLTSKRLASSSCCIDRPDLSFIERLNCHSGNRSGYTRRCTCLYLKH